MYSNKNLARSLFEKIKQGCLNIITSNNRYGRRVPETDILADNRINQLVNAWDVYADYVKAVECQADPQVVSDIIDGNHPPLAEFQHSLMLNALSHFIPTVNVLQGVYNEYYVGEDTGSSVRSGLILQIPTAIYDILTVLMCIYWTSEGNRTMHIFRPEVIQITRHTQSDLNVETVRGELWALQVQYAISHVNPELLKIFIDTVDGESKQELYNFAKFVYLQLGNIWKPISETSGIICITGNATVNEADIKVVSDGLRVLLRCTQEVLQTIEMPLSVYLAEHTNISSSLSFSDIINDIIEDMYKNSKSEIKYVSNVIDVNTSTALRMTLPGILRSEVDDELFGRIGNKYQKVFIAESEGAEAAASEEVEETADTCEQETQNVEPTGHVNSDGLVFNNDGFIILSDGTVVRESILGGYEYRQEASVGTMTMVVWCPITLQEINMRNNGNPVRQQVRPNQSANAAGTPPVDRVETEINNIISDINAHVHGLHVVHEVEANNIGFGDEEDFDIVSPEDFYAGISEPIEDMLSEEDDDEDDDVPVAARIHVGPANPRPATFARAYVDAAADTGTPITDEDVTINGIGRVVVNPNANVQPEFERAPRPGVLSAADIARILGQADAQPAQDDEAWIPLAPTEAILEDIIPDINADDIAPIRFTLNEEGVFVPAEAVQTGVVQAEDVQVHTVRAETARIETAQAQAVPDDAVRAEAPQPQERRFRINGQQISVRYTDAGVRIGR